MRLTHYIPKSFTVLGSDGKQIKMKRLFCFKPADLPAGTEDGFLVAIEPRLQFHLPEEAPITVFSLNFDSGEFLQISENREDIYAAARKTLEVYETLWAKLEFYRETLERKLPKKQISPYLDAFEIALFREEEPEKTVDNLITLMEINVKRHKALLKAMRAEAANDYMRQRAEDFLYSYWSDACGHGRRTNELVLFPTKTSLLKALYDLKLIEAQATETPLATVQKELLERYWAKPCDLNEILADLGKCTENETIQKILDFTKGITE